MALPPLGRVHSISMGFSIIGGRTPEDELPSSTVTYKAGRFGYGGVTWKLHPSAFLETKAALGVDRDEFIVGGSAKLTLGKPWQSSVDLGAELFQNLGPTLWVRLQWDSVPGMLMGASVVKTDLPDATLTGGVFVRWDVTRPIHDRFKVRAELSFGSRDGPGSIGGGLGSEFLF